VTRVLRLRRHDSGNSLLLGYEDASLGNRMEEDFPGNVISSFHGSKRSPQKYIFWRLDLWSWGHYVEPKEEYPAT